MMTRLLPCLAVAVALATATTTRVTMDDEPAFFAAALARDDAAARWRAEASAANVRALGVAPGRVVLLFAAPALSEEARALAALGYRVEAYDLVGDAVADVELRLVDRFLGDLAVAVDARLDVQRRSSTSRSCGTSSRGACPAASTPATRRSTRTSRR